MSRTTIIKEQWKSISGTFLLHDVLSISTISGSIDITIVPQSASWGGPPAEIHLQTVSGSINVKMAPQPSTVLPERILSCSLESVSGSIRPNLIQ